MDAARSKISDVDLRAIADSDDDLEPVDVIVELDAEAGAAPPGHVLAARPGRPPGIAPDPAEPFDAREGDMDRLERSLRGLRPPEPPRRFPTAQAFGVRLTPSQLREATRLPLVGAIRPSRTHRRP